MSEDSKTIFCVFCGKTHKLDELKSRPFFTTGTSYFCGYHEVARSDAGRTVLWNGDSFQEVR